jgi:hypothetical protein
MSDEAVKIGNLSEEELNNFRGFKQEEDELTFSIGQKYREALDLAISAGRSHQKSIDLLGGVRKRLNVEDGVLVRVDFNGEIFIINK